MIADRSTLALTFALSVTAVLAVAQTPGPPPAPTLGTPAEVRAFADALDRCAASTVATRHPLMATFVVAHAVTGEKSGTCAYSQTMPGKMTMACTFTAAGRQAMAADIRATAAGGPMGGGTSRSQPAWAKECEIVTASGARSPMAPPAR